MEMLNVVFLGLQIDVPYGGDVFYSEVVIEPIQVGALHFGAVASSVAMVPSAGGRGAQHGLWRVCSAEGVLYDGRAEWLAELLKRGAWRRWAGKRKLPNTLLTRFPT